MNNPAFVEIKDLKVSYGKKSVLCGLNLTIPGSQRLAILGPSGCGKTTLLRALAGFIKPDSGEVLIEGILVRKIPPHNRNISFVPQNLGLWPHLTVQEHLSLLVGKKSLKIVEWLDQLHLEDLKELYPHHLSRGQAQRVALARALISEPKMILLDEPLSSVDLWLKHEILQLLVSLWTKNRPTMVYVSHSIEEIDQFSERVMILDSSKDLREIHPRDLRGFVPSTSNNDI